MNISIVVSVFNEEQAVPMFWNELSRIIGDLPYNIDVVFVDDGSTDHTPILLDNIATNNAKVQSIHFSHNFGHEAAMLAGIEHSQGDAIICMDSDLQHPPTYIPEMVEQFQAGYEIVTMIRNQRADGGIRKRMASNFFYWVLNRLSKGQFEPNASDFFLISKRVSDIITSQYSERTRFLRGLIQSVGFKKTSLTFAAPSRVAGKSKYSLLRLFFLSLTAIATFSHLPLRLGIAVGFVFGGFSFIVAVYSVIMKFFGQPFSGYTTIVVLMSIGFSLLFIVIGIIGEYIGFIFSEVKKRPIYIIDRITLESQNIK